MGYECKGMIAPVFTPFDDEGKVDYAVIPDYLDFLLHNSVEGILVGGTTGEATNLTVDERIGVFKAFVKVAKEMELKVILQVGGAPLVEVLRMAKSAEEMKADAIMTLPELYFKPKTTEELVEYLKTVSKAAPSTPMIYYHFPMMTGVQVNVPEFFKMASHSFAFKGMKADLEAGLQVQALLRKDQRIYIANHILAPAAFVGFDSSIATVTNLFPAVVANLIEAAQAGDVILAQYLQTKLNGLVAAITAHGDFVPAMKAAMPLVTGIKVGPPRQPLTALTPEQTKELRASLRKLDFGRLK